MTGQSGESQPIEQLRDRWQRLRDEQPAIRTRAAADELGVSEAQLLATELTSEVTRLVDDWSGLISQLGTVGGAMALTRNDHAVHELRGSYPDEPKFYGQTAAVVGDRIDLRLFLGRWRHGFAVETPWKGGTRRSLQFFDAAGTATHKVYATKRTDIERWNELVERFRSDQSPSPVQVESVGDEAGGDDGDGDVDVDEFQQAWRDMEDTHQFGRMLGRFGVERTEAMRLAPEGMTRRVDESAAVDLLQTVRDADIPLMIFVGNRGALQIFSGTVNTLKRTGSWFNVLDPKFNLHLRDGGIHEAWVVRKPTELGIISSLELFDQNGETIALLFGRRKSGESEDERWRGVLDELE